LWGRSIRKIIHAKAAHRNPVVVEVVCRSTEGCGIAFVWRVVNSNFSNVGADDVKPWNKCLLQPSMKQYHATRNFVTSMISLVRGLENGLEKQCLMDSFRVDEGGGIRLRVYRDPRTILEGDIVVAALRGIVRSTCTYREAEGVGQGQAAPPSHLLLVST
jgi:hypothetical protein